MKKWEHNGDSLEAIIERHGPWSAMSIKLADGEYTREQAVDFRLKRLVQTAADLIKKPLNECRVLDLACLEGHYGIEFALQGAEAVCVEIREANLAKAAYSADRLGLDNITIYQDDVRNLNKEQYGTFDIVICSGILYHLQAEAAREIIHKIHECCTGIAMIDTYIAVRQDQTVQIDGKTYHGHNYSEHKAGTSANKKSLDLWASIDNESSFWFTHESLTTIAAEAGFTSFFTAAMPTMPGTSYDRRTYVAIKGEPVTIHSSEKTAAQPFAASGHEDPFALHPSQIKQGALAKAAKKVLPQGVKDAIKPVLRQAGVLKTKESPFKKSA